MSVLNDSFTYLLFICPTTTLFGKLISWQHITTKTD